MSIRQIHTQAYMDVRITLVSFLWEDKEEGFAISSFCVVLVIKNTLFFDCEKACL